MIGQICRDCGCTDDDPCLYDAVDPAGGTYAEACSWVEEDLCSACAEQIIEVADGEQPPPVQASGSDGFVLKGGLWLR